MNEFKETLIALIKGLCINQGNQYYSEKIMKEKQIEILINFIKNY